MEIQTLQNRELKLTRNIQTIIYLLKGAVFEGIQIRESVREKRWKVYNGINLHADADKRGSGWATPPTIFADWGDETWPRVMWV